MPAPTPQQKAAIEAAGNVLLMAGAGTGKTSTLVERCLHWLFHAQPHGSLDRLLMVTFTDAAATEMRDRIRAALWKRAQIPEHRDQAQAQLALLDTAHIRTLHSFNLELIRRHFLELKLDPQATVLAPHQARILQEETLDALWDHYFDPAQSAKDNSVRTWLKTLGPDPEPTACKLILHAHRRWRTLPHPEDWLDQQQQLLTRREPVFWETTLPRAMTCWARTWREYIHSLRENNFAPDVRPDTVNYARDFAKFLPESFNSLEEITHCLRSIITHNETSKWPTRQATTGRKPLIKFLGQAEEFLAYLPQETTNPLAEDWGYVRHWLGVFIELLRAFEDKYAETKRRQGALDFHDFEQFALKLLYDQTRQPSTIARQWRERFDFVLVDEYQDINPAQDAILRALSREGAQANRFLVGDIKQSIYRFRQADPKIFQQYAETWRHQEFCHVLPLTDNFRSREAILDFVNDLFTGLMIRDVGGVEYDESARLHFGAPEQRSHLTRAAEPSHSRCVELHLLKMDHPTSTEEASQEADAPAEEDPESLPEWETDKLRAEARMVAQRLQALKESGHPIWRRELNDFSPVDWRDMVILLRAPRGRMETFVQEFARAGIPLRADPGSLLESQEVRDLLNLLRLLDNPRQDLPLLAVLRSPLVGLKLDDLARIRLACRKGSLWVALQRWLAQAPSSPPPDSAAARVQRFMEHYRRWRDGVRRGSLVTCLTTILNDTLFDVWCRAQPQGVQRHANVQQLLHLAHHFDHLQRQGLHRFLQLVETYKDLELPAESPQTVTENCVRLMSIHQSKGLEFPVVVLATLSAQFNLVDQTQEMIWDDELGWCTKVHPPGRPPYRSLLHHLAALRQREEMLGEELRLLYVALTRACDLLILSGSISAKHRQRWQKLAGLALPQSRVLDVLCPLDWVGTWWSKKLTPPNPPDEQGQNEFLAWQFHNAPPAPDQQPPAPDKTEPTPPAPQEMTGTTDWWKWQYPALAATREPAKTHVSALRRRAAHLEEQEASGEADLLPQARPPRMMPARWADQERGLQTGAVHHLFLERLDLRAPLTEEALRAEAQRLVAEGVLSQDEAAGLNYAALSHFWAGETGSAIRNHASQVHREIPFTARFTAADLKQVGVPVDENLGPEEFMVVQGVADLVVLLEKELWVLDYKSDHITAHQVAERTEYYAPQLRLYALALSRIYARPASRLWLHFLHPGVTQRLSLHV